MADSYDGLVLVWSLFRGRAKRLVDADCCAGKIPGARKVGRQWMIRPADFDAYVATTPSSGAAADLARAGFRKAS